MAKGQNVNNPSATVDDTKFIRQGHTSGPYGNDPSLDARGDFGRPPKDLK